MKLPQQELGASDGGGAEPRTESLDGFAPPSPDRSLGLSGAGESGVCSYRKGTWQNVFEGGHIVALWVFF